MGGDIMTAEAFLIRMTGGPHSGDRVIPSTVMEWPLPAELPVEGGKYVKTSESQLPPQDPDSHIMRGAQYAWQPNVEVPA